MNKKSSQKRRVHRVANNLSPSGRAGIARNPAKLWNAGQELLRGALERDGFGVRQVAGLTDISPTMMSCLLAGQKLPGPDSRDTLCRYFGVPTDAWDHAPGWRPDDWEPSLWGDKRACRSILTFYGMLNGILEPTPITVARLKRELPPLE